jgi:hypothetical protein
MVMPPAVRRSALAVHVLCSVGWIGAAAAYLALAMAAEISGRPQTVRAAWIGMEMIGWFVIVPLGCLAFFTGLVMAVGTPWGLIQYYWVLIALTLTTVALAVLVLHMPSVSTAGDLARSTDDRAATHLGGDIIHPALGLVVLLFVAVLNIFKPRGLTPYGQRRRGEAQTRSQFATKKQATP